MENLCIAFSVHLGFSVGPRLIVCLQVCYKTSEYTADHIWVKIMEVATEIDELFFILEGNTRCNPEDNS